MFRGLGYWCLDIDFRHRNLAFYLLGPDWRPDRKTSDLIRSRWLPCKSLAPYYFHQTRGELLCRKPDGLGQILTKGRLTRDAPNARGLCLMMSSTALTALRSALDGINNTKKNRRSACNKSKECSRKKIAKWAAVTGSLALVEVGAAVVDEYVWMGSVGREHRRWNVRDPHGFPQIIMYFRRQQ